MAKVKTPVDEKFEKQSLDIFEVLGALDRKDYGYYNRLTEEQKTKFVPYLITIWMSAVNASQPIMHYYLSSTDYYVNGCLFHERITQYPEVQWLLLCAVSPGAGKQRHQWIPQLSTSVTSLRDAAKVKDVREYFEKIYAGAPKSVVAELAQQWTDEQHLRRRLCRIFPQMKMEDVTLLAKTVTQKQLDDYERDIGN